jgi:MoaA/NifB/PqqE/SkfB family radical SAM enzyme
MSKIISIEPAIDPTARPTFLLDWELTLKCNLDCSYCPTPQQVPLSVAYHDNTADHPPLDECLKTIDFMYEYVDAYMEYKPRWTRAVVMNIYGGESLFHPDIAEILKQVKIRHEQYKDRWPITVTCTTNGVVGQNRMLEIVDLIDEFTVSYHAESLKKQKQQVKENLLLIKQKQRRLKCVILMHGNQEHWPELLELVEFCKQHDINCLPRQLDGPTNSNYSSEQVVWFKDFWKQKNLNKSQAKQQEILADKTELESDKRVTLNKVGRACCGGRLMCTNSELKDPIFYVPDNVFTGWSCSVNWFFLYVKQHTREIFTNKDCRMRFDGTVGPIGNLDQAQDLIEETKKLLENKNMPVITCAKDHCWCGLCAPKAKHKEDFFKIMEKHITEKVLR